MAKKTTYLRTRTRLLATAVSACFTASVYALPTDPAVVNGSASFAQAGNVLNVTNSNGAIINWNTFSIGANETTRFIQTSSSSSVLNRVLAADPSVILGSLTSNGRVFLINPSGIYVGQGARVDVAGFVASTLNLSNANFLANKLQFDANPNAGNVINQGNITTPSGGSVYIVAPNVTNEGIITTPHGETILAAGQSVTLLDTGTPGVSVEIVGAQGNTTNLGQIVAEAGRIGIAGVIVKNSGTLDASSAVIEGGRVFLKASQDAYVDGKGRIVTTGSKGGTVEVLGNNRVEVKDDASIDASGTNGGGTVLIGGDYQGKNPNIQNSAMTYFGPNASLKADATGSGNGGKIIVWADDTTRAYGSISARGGQNGGNGGFIETSGKAYLDVNGIMVDARAPQGQKGTWLLDPHDIIVASSGAAPYTDVNNSSAQAGYALTISPTTLDAAGANVDLQASHDITFRSPLTLTTYGAGVTATAGNALVIESGSGITTNNGAVALTGNSMSIQGNISTSGGAMALTGGYGGVSNHASISSGGGAVAITGNGGVSNDGSVISVGGTISLSSTYGQISSPGTLDFGSGPLSLSSDYSNINAQVVSGSGPISANAGGSITLMAATGSNLSLNSVYGSSVQIEANSGSIDAAFPTSSVGAAGTVSLKASGHIGSSAQALNVNARNLLINTLSSFNVVAPIVTNLDMTLRASGIGTGSAITGPNLGGLKVGSSDGITVVADDQGSPLSLSSLGLHVNGPLKVATISGVGSFTATADSDITLGRVSAGSVSLTSSGNINAAADDTNYELDVTGSAYLQAAGNVGGGGINHLDIRGPNISLTAGTSVGADAAHAVRTTSTGFLDLKPGTTFNVKNVQADTGTPLLLGTTPEFYSSLSLTMNATGMSSGSSSIAAANFPLSDYALNTFSPTSTSSTVTVPALVNTTFYGGLSLAVNGNLSIANVAPVAGALSLRASGTLTQSSGNISLGSNSLNLNAGGSISVHDITAGHTRINQDVYSYAAVGLGVVNTGADTFLVRGNGISTSTINAGYVNLYSNGGITIGGDGHVTSTSSLYLTAQNGGISTGSLSGYSVNLYAGFGSINTSDISAQSYVNLESHNSAGSSDISVGNVDLTPWGSFSAVAPDGALTMGNLWGYGGDSSISSATINTGGAFVAGNSTTIKASNLSIHTQNSNGSGYGINLGPALVYANTVDLSADSGYISGYLHNTYDLTLATNAVTGGGFDITSNTSLTRLSISGTANAIGSFHDSSSLTGYSYLVAPSQSFGFGSSGGVNLSVSSLSTPLNLAVHVTDSGMNVNNINTYGGRVTLVAGNGSISGDSGEARGVINTGTAPVILVAGYGSVGAGYGLDIKVNGDLQELSIWARNKVDVSVNNVGTGDGNILNLNVGVNASGTAPITIAANDLPANFLTRDGSGNLTLLALPATTALAELAIVGRDGNLKVNSFGGGALNDLNLTSAGNLTVDGDITTGNGMLTLQAGVSTWLYVDGYGANLDLSFDRAGDVLAGSRSISTSGNAQISAGGSIFQDYGGSISSTGGSISMVAARDVRAFGSVSGKGYVFIAAGANPSSYGGSSSGLGGDVIIGNGTDAAGVSSLNNQVTILANAGAYSGAYSYSYSVSGGNITLASNSNVTGYSNVDIHADRNATINGTVSVSGPWWSSIDIEAGNSTFGGNLTLGATSSISTGGGDVGLYAYAGSESGTGNITQFGGGQIYGRYTRLYASRNIDISGHVGSSDGTWIEAGYDASRGSGGPGGSIHLSGTGHAYTDAVMSYGVKMIAHAGTDGAATGSITLDPGSIAGADSSQYSRAVALVADRNITANGSINGDYGVGLFAGGNITVGDGITPNSGKIEALHGAINLVSGSYASYYSGSYAYTALDYGYLQSPSGGDIAVKSGASLHANDWIGLYAFGTASGGGNIKTYGGSTLLAEGINDVNFSSVDIIGARNVTVDGDVTSNNHHVYIAAGQDASSYPPTDAIASNFGGDVSIGGSITATNSSLAYGGVAIRAMIDPSLAYTDPANAKGNIFINSGANVRAGSYSFVDISAGGDIHAAGSVGGYEVVLAAGVSGPHSYEPAAFSPYPEVPVSGRGGDVYLESGSNLKGGRDVHVYASAGTVSTSSHVHGGNITQAYGGSITAASVNANAVTGITLTGATNAFGTLSAYNSTSGNIHVRNAGALTLGPVTTYGGAITITTTGTLTLANAVSSDATGDAVTLVGNGFDVGSGSIYTPLGRWLVWSANPASDNIGSLAYDFTQYNANYGVNVPAQITGNGLLYSYAPNLTVALSNSGVTKTYDGLTAASFTPAYSVSGFVDSASTATFNYTAAAFNNAHVDVGTTHNNYLTVSGLSFAATVKDGSGKPVYGYQLSSPAASSAPGSAWINPAPLTVTANNAAKSYGQTASFAGTAFTSSGLQNSETIGSVSETSTGEVATAHVLGSPYAIVASNATGGSFNSNDYSISYVNGSLTVSPSELTVNGNWSLPGSWIGGALPQNADVSGVLIPTGVTVAFDGSAGPNSIPYLTSAGALSMQGGNLTISGALRTAGFSQTAGNLSAGSVDINTASAVNINGGSLSSSGNVNVVAESLSMSGGHIYGNGPGITAPDGRKYAIGIAATNVSLDNGSNIIATNPATSIGMVISGGDLTLNNGSHIKAGQDVVATMTGSSALVVLNSAAGKTPSTIETQLTAHTTHIEFLSLSSGGIVIDGAQTTTTASGGSGFYALGSPAILGNGLKISFMPSENVAARTIDKFFDNLSRINWFHEDKENPGGDDSNEGSCQ